MEWGKHKKHESLGRLINEISRSSHIFFHHAFRKHDIGHAQLRTLLFISRNENPTQNEIAKYLNLDKSSITSQIKILEKNGYIQRQTSVTDARMQILKITQKTRDILVPLRKGHSKWSDALLKDFSKSEREVLFSYLERMRSNAMQKLKEVCRGK